MKKAHTGRYSRQCLQDAPRLGAIGITRRRYDETVTPLPPERTGLHLVQATQADHDIGYRDGLQAVNTIQPLVNHAFANDDGAKQLDKLLRGVRTQFHIGRHNNPD